MATIAKLKPDRKEPPDDYASLAVTLGGSKAKILVIAVHIAKLPGLLKQMRNCEYHQAAGVIKLGRDGSSVMSKLYSVLLLILTVAYR